MNVRLVMSRAVNRGRSPPSGVLPLFTYKMAKDSRKPEAKLLALVDSPRQMRVEAKGRQPGQRTRLRAKCKARYQGTSEPRQSELETGKKGGIP